MSVQILIVEDDEDIADLVAYNLERQGWQTVQMHHGTEGWEYIARRFPDVVILDLTLPGMDGFDIFRRMKEHESTSRIPVLILTARTQLEDRLTGLQLGADDYITKPFSTKELVLRVRNLLNRLQGGALQLRLRSGALILDKNTLRTTLRGEPLDLTPTEFKLLAYLMEREGKPQDRYDLQQVLFGYADTTQSRALDTHIKRLRRKLGDYAECISTERGIGYTYIAPKTQD